MDENDDDNLSCLGMKNDDNSDNNLQNGSTSEVDGHVDETNDDDSNIYKEVSDIKSADTSPQEEKFHVVPQDDEAFPSVLDGSLNHEGECDDMGKSFCEVDGSGGEYFILSTLDEVKKLIDDYSERTGSHFVVHKKTKHFGLPGSSPDISGHRIQWHDIRLANHDQQTQENMIEFDGVPHITVGHYQLNCQFGADSSATQKEKRRKMKEEGEINVRSRTLKTPTKKCGCPAKIVVKQIIRYPEFKVTKDTVRRKSTNSGRLKELLKTNPVEVLSEVSYIGRLADVGEHKFHDLIQGEGFSKEEVHRDIILKVQELYLQNNSIDQILKSLKEYVQNEMFWKQEPPDPCRRRYYPRRKDILNFITRVRNLSKFTQDEEQKIKGIIGEVKSRRRIFKIAFNVSDEIITEESSSEAEKMDNTSTEEFFEMDSMDKEKNITKKEERKVQTFLFCYQTPCQRRLMRMYSNVVYLTELHYDAVLKSALTYKCYMLLVQTNVDYQVIGFIAVSKQKKNGLMEGLKLFQEWNTFWNPKYLFVDCTDVMFDSIMAVFPDAGQFLNLESCENKWMEFVSTPSNNVQEYSEEIMGYLRGMQYSLTEESLAHAASLFEGSEVWQDNEKLRRWFQGKWLHLAKCWVFGYRPEDLIVMHHLNFSVSDCILPYEDAFNRSIQGDGVVELLATITGNITDEEYEKYKRRNTDHFLYYNRFANNCGVSDGLQGVPITLLPYVYQMFYLQEKNDFNITEDQIGVFTVTYDVSDKLGACKSDSADKCHNHGCIGGTPSKKNNTIVDKDNTIVDKDSTIVRKDGTIVIKDCTIVSKDREEINTSDDNEESNGIPIKLFDTKFSVIRYLDKAEVGSFTVSFGDTCSHPFCTCSFWNTYKLPCVHMTAIFCKIPGWRYHMLSPLYRFNPVIDIDTSCISSSNNSNNGSSNDKQCQVSAGCFGTSVGIQVDSSASNIFECPSNIGITDSLLGQVKILQEHVCKASIIFRDKQYQRKVLEGLQCFVTDAQIELSSIPKLVNPMFKLERKDMNVNKTNTGNYTIRTCGDTFKNFKICSEINEKLLSNVNKECSSSSIMITNTSSTNSTNDVLQVSMSNTTPEKRHYRSISPNISNLELNTNELQLKRRKLTNILTELNDKKVALPVLSNLHKEKNDSKINYGSRPILPSGPITLAHLSGKNKIQHNVVSDKDVHLEIDNCDAEVRKENIVEHNEESGKDNVTETRNVTETPNNIKILPMKLTNNKRGMQTQHSATLPHSKYISYYNICRKPQTPQGVITLAHLTGKTNYSDVNDVRKLVEYNLEENQQIDMVIECDNEMKNQCG